MTQLPSTVLTPVLRTYEASCAYYHGQSLEHSSYQEGCRHAPQRLYRSETGAQTHKTLYSSPGSPKFRI